MRSQQQRSENISAVRNSDQVLMLRHQAACQYVLTSRAQLLLEQFNEGGTVLVAEETLLLSAASLENAGDRL